MTERPDFCVIGAGAVGAALASRLSASGWRAGALVASSPASARAAVRAARCGRPSTDPARAAREARWTILALPAARIEPACRMLAREGAFRPGARVVHVNGSLDRSALAAAACAGARVGAAHPFQTFVRGTVPRWDGVLWGIDAAPDFLPELSRWVRRTGGIPCPVRARARPAYHAAAVFAANHVVVQAAWAEEILARCGVPRRDARRGVAAILRQTAGNVAVLGPSGALTGPAARGETAVVRRQLAAVRSTGAGEAAAAAYRACARGAALLGGRRT